MPILGKSQPVLRPRALKPPKHVAVRGLFTGTNVIKWQRMGRGAGLEYLIESRLPNEIEWSGVALVDGY